MPRPKSELTKSEQGKVVSTRVSHLQFAEWRILGGAKWLRLMLTEARWRRLGRSVENITGEVNAKTKK